MHSPSRILVVRVGRAGDMVMITPALRALLAAFPDDDLHLVTSADGRRVLRGFDPRLTRFFTYSTGVVRELLGRRRLIRALRAERTTRVVVLETSARYLRLARELDAPAAVLPAAAGVRHYAERCLDLVEQTAGMAVPRGWVGLPVTAAGRAAAAAYLHAHGIGASTCLVGLHATYSGSANPLARLSGTYPHRTWPAGSFAQFAATLAAHARARGADVRIVADTLPGERRMVEPIARASGGAVTVLAGPPDFERYKAVLERLALLVTPDTGPMHVAAAVGTPLVALFSRKSPEDCGPFTDPGRYTVLRAEETPDPERGLAAIAPEAVFRASLRFLPEL